jgi:DNA-binding transcriptional LysR family regulator
MALRLEQLRYFATVAEEGQITRAARKLHIAQPALSQAISQLEAELGIELLERHPRGVALTPAGDRFLEKARAALTATNEAALTAESLARAASQTIEVGYIGPLPTAHAPELFGAFAQTHPDASVSFRELPFPTGPTGSWLEEVDVAFCHLAGADPRVLAQPLRAERRAVVAPSQHELAAYGELTVDDVLDETFISYHPMVQQAWAGRHSLDDHRGEPARRVTADRVRTPAEMLKSMSMRQAITTVPVSDAAIIERTLRGVEAIPIRDADPMVLALMWRADQESPLVDDLVALARELAADQDSASTRSATESTIREAR